MLKLIIFDLDGTLVQQKSSWEFVHNYFGKNNDESLKLYLRGEIDDLEFMRRDIEIWKKAKNGKVHIKEIEKILAKIKVVRGAMKTLKELKKRKIKTAIVSGGLDILAERVAKELGIDYVVANSLEVDKEGFLIGEGILRVEVKDKGKAVKKLLKKLKIKKEHCISVGNSEYDCSMFEESKFGIAFCPLDKKVKEKASFVIKNLREILEYI